MAQTTVGHIFISYSRKDEAVMRRIVRFLRKQGIVVWVDNEKLTPGTPIWEAEIEKAIRGASAIVIVLSPDSKKSVWVRREITLAEQYEKHSFPVLVRGDEDDSIPIRLITSQFVDLRQSERSGLHKLSTALTFYLDELRTQESQAQEETQQIVPAEQEATEKIVHERDRLEKAVLTGTTGAGNFANWIEKYPKSKIVAIVGIVLTLSFVGWIANSILKNNNTHVPTSSTSASGSTATSQSIISDTLPTSIAEENFEATQVTTTTSERAWGIDVSFFESEINWNRITNEGIDFAFVKATEGTSYIDPTFQENWDTLKQLEIPRGAYHYFRIAEDPKLQADFFASQITILPGDLPPVLVLDATNGLENDVILSRLQTALNELELKTGQRPILYTGYFFLDDHLRDQTGSYPDWLASYPLWIGQYPSEITNIELQQPPLPDGWQGNWLFWQYTGSGTINGIETQVDMNLFNGSPADLQEFLGLSGERAWGIDILFHMGEVDWPLVKSVGTNFVFIRATQGETFVDPFFENYWAGAKAAGILRGAYHYFDPDLDPVRQVDNFIQVFEEQNYDGELPPVLDIEDAGVQSNEELLVKLKTALTELERVTGRQPILYSGTYFIRDRLVDRNGEYPDWLTMYPLWVANYLTDGTNIQTEQPILPGGWQTGWLFWQYTDQGTVSGISTSVDLNFFNGTTAELQKFLETP